MKKGATCYRCNASATTMEHVPPKSLFPKGGNLQLKTVPSCTLHNNDKSGDDQYLLAHICMNAGAGDNLPKQIFMRSIAPQLQRSKKFRRTLADGSIDLADGARKYIVDVARFNNFFDHLLCAIYFDRYGLPLDEQKHQINHHYLSLITKDPVELQQRQFLTEMLGDFFKNFQELISHYQADKINEVVYQNKVIDPAGQDASITIAHTFYGVFEVVSLLTRQWLTGNA